MSKRAGSVTSSSSGEPSAHSPAELEGGLSPDVVGLHVDDEGPGPVKPWADAKKVKGFSCVLLAAFIWVVSSYWVQDLEGQGMTPLLVTSLANSMFTVLLPVCLVRDWISRRSKRRRRGQLEVSVALVRSKRYIGNARSSEHPARLRCREREHPAAGRLLRCVRRRTCAALGLLNQGRGLEGRHDSRRAPAARRAGERAPWAASGFGGGGALGPWG